jgi:hypothetical protein
MGLAFAGNVSLAAETEKDRTAVESHAVAVADSVSGSC